MSVSQTTTETFIAITGLVALTMSLSPHELVRHMSPWFGLMGQPFWLAYFARDAKWGFLIVSVAMTFVWIEAWARSLAPLYVYFFT